MKKLISIILVMAMALSMTGCGAANKQTMSNISTFIEANKEELTQAAKDAKSILHVAGTSISLAGNQLVMDNNGNKNNLNKNDSKNENIFNFLRDNSEITSIQSDGKNISMAYKVVGGNKATTFYIYFNNTSDVETLENPLDGRMDSFDKTVDGDTVTWTSDHRLEFNSIYRFKYYVCEITKVDDGIWIRREVAADSFFDGVSA